MPYVSCASQADLSTDDLSTASESDLSRSIILRAHRAYIKSFSSTVDDRKRRSCQLRRISTRGGIMEYGLIFSCTIPFSFRYLVVGRRESDSIFSQVIHRALSAKRGYFQLSSPEGDLVIQTSRRRTRISPLKALTDVIASDSRRS